MAKDITLKATVFERCFRFTTNFGLVIEFNPLSIERWQEDFDEALISLAMPVRKYWQDFEKKGLITARESRGYRWAEWRETYFAIEASELRARAVKARHFTNIYSEFGLRRDTFPTWTALFLDVALAETVGAALASKLDMLPEMLFNSGYTYDLEGKGAKPYNGRDHSKNFKAMLSNTFDGVVVPATH